MHRVFYLALGVLVLGGCEGTDPGSDSSGETGGGACSDAPGEAGCPCADETVCDPGLACLEVEGGSECGCEDPNGAGCPCGGDEDCGDGTCVDGFCAAGCGPEVDLMTDIDNCGTCGQACADADGSCQGGECYAESSYADCFVPGGDVSCEDVCQELGAAFACAESCASGGWAGYDIPSCMDAPAQTGGCADLIANPFASVQCCCAEKLG